MANITSSCLYEYNIYKKYNIYIKVKINVKNKK